MKTKIILDGELGERFGKVRELDLSIPGPQEALHMLCTLVKGFREYLQEHAKTEYQVFVGNRNIGEDELFLPSGRKTIRIMPALSGSKSQGVGQMIVGAVLIIVGCIIGYVYGWTGIGGIIGKGMVQAGIGVMAGGVAQLLFSTDPAKESTEKADNRASYLFNGPINTTGQGNCGAIVYGEVEVGSQVISAGIFTEEAFIPWNFSK